jgi:hypothetical protein
VIREIEFTEQIEKIPRTPSPEWNPEQPISPEGPPRKSRGPSPLSTTFVQESKGPFVDPDFRPLPRSIGKTISEDPASRLRISRKERDAAEWIRLPDFIKATNKLRPDADIELFGNIEPNDLTQGIVGDCWLLATMACIAEFPNAVESLFCGQTGTSPIGKYRIRLYDLDKRSWEVVTIDDFIPCKREGDVLRPLFAIPNGNQMWAALLEKAMAKFVGSYAQIAGGHEPFAMIAFTGFPQVYQFKRLPINEAKTIAKAGEWERGWAQWAGKFSPSCGYRPMLGEDRFLSNEVMFQRLLEYDRMNYLLAASIVCYDGSVDSIRPDGLVNGHAYSLLSVEQFGSIRLVKLRNPHGEGTAESPTEWNGKWSDDSEEWSKYSDIANTVGFERIHDGIFWMEFDDFFNIYDKLLVLPFPMSQPRGALSSMRRAKIRASIRTATQLGKAKAVMAMENLTHVDEVVTALHLMSVGPYDPYLNAPQWVRDDPETHNKWAHEKLGIPFGKDAKS